MGREIEVDLWKTGMHKVEVGIKKDEEHQAKSRQFTKDSDIIGEYKYKDEQSSGYLVIRTDPWESDLSSRRLVMKIFTESMNWKGSVEEMLGAGLTQTLGANEGMPVYMINLTNHDHLIRLERTFKPRSMNKAMYTFMLIEENNFYSYRIEADRFTLGSDWDVFDMHDNKIAKIDGKKFNIGGKWIINIKDDEYDLHSTFDEVILLFAALVKFEADVRDKLEDAAKKLKKNEEDFRIELDNEEIALYDNPRRVTY